MSKRYRLFRRGRVFYAEDTVSGKQESLKTKIKDDAQRLLHAKNEAHLQPALHVQIARAYLLAGDPKVATRTWQNVMDEAAKMKSGPTLLRWETSIRQKVLDAIRNKPVLETRAEDFIQTLSCGTVSTNIFLRRVHNFALEMNWLPVPLLPRRRWPRITFKDRRSITFQEHQRILGSELEDADSSE